MVVAFPKRDKPVLRDARVIQTFPDGTRFAAVVDARGFSEPCADIAQFAQQAVSTLAQLASTYPTESMIPSWFEATQTFLTDHYRERRIGAAACALMFKPDQTLVVAHAGNSRLYRFNRENLDGTQSITVDHTMDRPDEVERVRSLLSPTGVSVQQHGHNFPPAFRTKPYLHHFVERHGWSAERLRCTRGFGHESFRPVFTHVPEIRILQEESLHNTRFYALCTKGGAKAVRYAFRRLLDLGDPGYMSIQELADLARTKLLANPKGPKHDATIIFFRVSPDPADL